MEFCIMACFLILLARTTAAAGSVRCPDICSCRYGHSPDGDNGLFVTCCSNSSQPLDPQTIDRLRLPTNTFAVDFSNCFLKKFPLHAIAGLPQLQRLNLANMLITELEQAHLANLTVLRILNVTSGKLTSVEPGAFRVLQSLEELDISFNDQLHLSQLPNIFTGLNETKLRRLFIDGINYYKYTNETRLLKEYLIPLGNLSLDVLTVIYAGVQSFDPLVLQYLRNIKCMSLASNADTVIGYMTVFTVFKEFLKMKLQVVSIANQYLTELYPRGGHKLNCLKHRLQLLDACAEVLSHPEPTCSFLTQQQVRPLIHQHPNRLGDSLIHITSPPHLQRINADRYLGNANLGLLVFSKNVFTHITVRNCVRITLTGPVYGMNCLKVLEVAGSRLIIQNGDTFSHFPKLEVLNISGCDIKNQMENHDKVLFKGMLRLLVLDISHNKINRVFLENLHKDAPQLQELYMQGNTFSRIPQIVPPPNLQLVDLRHIGLITLTGDDRHRLESLDQVSPGIQIDIRQNVLDCRCGSETFSFLKWLQTTQLNLTKPAEISCSVSDINGRKVVSALGIHSTDYWWHCYRETVINAIIAASVLCVVVLCVAIIHKLRFRITYQFYRLKNRASCSPRTILVSRPPTGYLLLNSQQNLPKVYVIFDTKDENVTTFVHTSIKDILGDSFYMLTNNDLQPGRIEISSIVVAIEASACSLVILSPGITDDVKAIWGVMYATGRSPHHPLVIEYTPLPPRNLLSKEASVVRELIKAGRSVKWGVEGTQPHLAAVERIKSHLKDHSNVTEVCDGPPGQHHSASDDEPSDEDVDEDRRRRREQMRRELADPSDVELLSVGSEGSGGGDAMEDVPLLRV